MERSCGILMPIFSLPSSYGIGSLGKEAYSFADFLKKSGRRYWQLLPLGPTSYGDSPYQSFSSAAGNPYFIDLDMLCEDGLLSHAEIEAVDWGRDEGRVDYEKLYLNRFRILERAKQRGYGRDKAHIAAFVEANRAWLLDYALFMALKRHFGMLAWPNWPDDAARRHDEAALAAYRIRLKPDIELFIYMQYLFFKQWQKLKSYTNSLGISIIGDVPIYVAMDSAEVWAERELFALNGQLVPEEVAGVPPDYFNADGQLWGNPLYNWQRLEETGFDWWIRRMSAAARLYDVIRIDHFRGLESYYAVPCGEKTARHGRWIKGPGMKLITAIKNGVKGAEFIAEDLGYATDEVRALLAQSGFPGMRVLQFAFDGLCPNEHQPHAYSQNSICYTGTHDNSPIALWREETSQAVLDYARKYMAVSDTADMGEAMIRLGMASVAKLFIAQMQDHLGLSYGSRINVPGTACGNWQWRMDKAADLDTLAARLYEQAELYARI